MNIKRTPADIAFSLCIREAAGWKCQKCGKYYPEGSRGGLECSHHHSRGNWSIRFDPLNAESLCTGCHFKYGGTQERREEVLTEDEQVWLFRRKENTFLGRKMRKTKGKGAIAKHFRDEHKRIISIRETGKDGLIEFEAWT